MLAAFLTAMLWSVATVSAGQGARLIGGVTFNLTRLLLAALLLGLWGHILGSGLQGSWVGWFVLSGVIGFGVGDLAGYAAIHRVGSRLFTLVTHCLSMPIAALLEWVWLGTRLRLSEVFWAALILLGVSVATTLPGQLGRTRRELWLGVSFGAVAALTQALGAVISRKAYAIALAGGVSVDAGTATYQRVLGGAAMVLLIALGLSRSQSIQPGTLATGPAKARDWRRVPPWLVLHTLSGPVVGVACFQWALSTTPAGVVLPILAIVPLLVMPLAYFVEGEAPTARTLGGGVVAVAAACALAAGRQ
jgi:drug/metabolite transporter (DMT)-like permease